MDFKQLQKAVANLNWNINFYTFCRSILQKNGTNEQLENDSYCLEKWQKWQEFNRALHFSDDDTLERIISLCESNNT